jgi:hypothetical protein
MSKEKWKERIQAMRDNFDVQNKPKVSIFWYDQKSDSLFDVTKINSEDLSFNSNGIKTVSMLHKSYWQKKKNRALRKKGEKQEQGIYAIDYVLVPRGRLFQLKDGTFSLNCGSWINKHTVVLVIEEFDLQSQSVKVEVDPHWEIRHDWSEEYNS